MSEIKDNVLESEAIVEKIAQLRGETTAFIEKPWKLPKERDDSHMRVLPVNTRSETSRMESPSSAESSCTEESDPSIKVETENPNLKTWGIKPKLPKLHLPKFSGEITKFQTLWG